MKKPMKTTDVLILRTEKADREEGLPTVWGIVLKDMTRIDRMKCSSKRPLQLGAVDKMYIYSGLLRCNDLTIDHPLESADQRIENILDASEALREKMLDETGKMFGQVAFSYYVSFSQMANAMKHIVSEEMNLKKDSAFSVQLDNILEGVDDFKAELAEKQKKQSSAEIEELLREKSKDLCEQMHKIDITWDIEFNRSMNGWLRAAEEGLDTKKLLNVKPNKPKESKQKQTNLMDFS